MLFYAVLTQRKELIDLLMINGASSLDRRGFVYEVYSNRAIWESGISEDALINWLNYIKEYAPRANLFFTCKANEDYYEEVKSQHKKHTFESIEVKHILEKSLPAQKRIIPNVSTLIGNYAGINIFKATTGGGTTKPKTKQKTKSTTKPYIKSKTRRARNKGLN